MAHPRYQVGTVVGRITVLEILGTEFAYGRHDWVYRWQCACGTIERIPERNIRKGRQDCMTCARLRNRRNAQSNSAPVVKLPTQTPHGIPNPALLPVPKTITTGPENWRRVGYAVG